LKLYLAEKYWLFCGTLVFGYSCVQEKDSSIFKNE
jgi:hypothetical protein